MARHVLACIDPKTAEQLAQISMGLHLVGAEAAPTSVQPCGRRSDAGASAMSFLGETATRLARIERDRDTRSKTSMRSRPTATGQRG
jgi:hypothetical protein